MSDLQERITKRARAEARYLRGYQCMNLERFRYYRDEFWAARERSDIRKMHGVVQGTGTISNDTIPPYPKRMAIGSPPSFISPVNMTPHGLGDTPFPPPPQHFIMDSYIR